MVQNYSNESGNGQSKTIFAGIHWDQKYASEVTKGFNNSDKIMAKDLPKILNEYTAASIATGNFGSAIITTAISRFIALPAEIREDGLVKGALSWGASNIGEAVGIVRGVIEGIKTGNLSKEIYDNIIKYSDLADSYADKGCDVIANYFKNLFNQPAKQPQCPASPLDFVQAEKFLNENSSTPLQDAINDRINLTDMLNQGNQSFLESLGLPDMQKQYGFLSEPAYGLSYAHFNTTQNDPFENDFINSLFNPYGVMGDPSAQMSPPPIIMLNPDVEAVGDSSRVDSIIDSYINGTSSEPISDAESAIDNSSSSGGSDSGGDSGGDEGDDYGDDEDYGDD